MHSHPNSSPSNLQQCAFQMFVLKSSLIQIKAVPYNQKQMRSDLDSLIQVCPRQSTKHIWSFEPDMDRSVITQIPTHVSVV